VHLMVSALLGVVFALLFGPKVRTVGAGFVWGEAFGVLWWLVGSLTLLPLLSGHGLDWSVEAIRQSFALLLGQFAAFGATMGLTYFGFWILDFGVQSKIHNSQFTIHNWSGRFCSAGWGGCLAVGSSCVGSRWPVFILSSRPLSAQNR
ncbi:MAG: hypothetical protein ACRDIB_09160, partial [Ardenticatenaceae bacterium]